MRCCHVRERVRERDIVGIHAVAEQVVRRSCWEGRTPRSGTCRTPARSPAARCRRRRRRAGGRSGSRRGRRQAPQAVRSRAEAEPPGHAPLTPGLSAVFRRSRSDWVSPVKFSPGTPVSRISERSVRPVSSMLQRPAHVSVRRRAVENVLKVRDLGRRVPVGEARVVLGLRPVPACPSGRAGSGLR